MQAKDLSLHDPNELTLKQPRAFGVLANSNAATPLATKAPSIINSKQKEQPVPNLENENQTLKSQVEMLKSLLLGICKDQNIQHPLLNVFDQSPSKISIESLSSISQFSNKPKSPQKGSPKKLLQQSKENNFDFQNEKTQHTLNNTDNSPSPKRRKRSDRVKSTSPMKEQGTTLRKMRQSIQEMPLQILPKDQIITEEQQQENDNNQSNVHYNDDSARFENVLDQDQTRELNENEDAHNSSQLHLKYAKMLEELDDQSQNCNSNEINEVELRPEQINVIQKELDKTQIVSQKLSRTTHLRNKLSSQIEHKNFYELELEQLKQELEQVAQEEEKLLSILDKKDDIQESNEVQVSPLKPYTESNEYSPKIRLLYIPVNDNIRETEGEEETFSLLSDRVMQEMTPVKKLTSQDLLNNLKDEVDYMLENEGHDDSGFLRPVKIGSPQNCYSQTKFNKQYLENSGGRISALSSCKKVSDKITPQKEIVSSFDKRSPIHKKASPAGGKSPTKRFSVQRTDICPQNSPPRSPMKKSQSSNKRNRNQKKNMFEMKRIGDHSESKDDISNRSLQELDQLAKESALGQGLQQQEEPMEDENFDDLDCLNNPQIISTTKPKVEKAQKPAYIGDFFGQFSKSKSEELRNQRQESIKRAEELLSNTLQHEQPKRPDFISKYQNKAKQDYEQMQNDIILECKQVDIDEGDEDNNIYGQLEQQIPLIQLQEVEPNANINDISFQDQEVAAINYVRFNQTDSSENSSKYQSCLNIEIPTSIHGNANQTQVFQDIVDSPVKNTQVTLKYQAYINKKLPNDPLKAAAETQIVKSVLESNKKEANRSPFRHKYNQTQTINQRRKSVGNEYSKKAQASTAFLMQNMQTKSRVDNQSVISMAKSSNHPSCKPSPFKKDKTQCTSTKNGVNHQELQQQQYQNNFDAELLYQFRAKSVIKRREELLSKRQQENKQKVQAKNDKIDKLRQSRNSRLSNQRSNKDQYSAMKVHEYNDNVSQISVDEPRFYQSNIECLSQNDIGNHFTPQGTGTFQRSSLPSTQANVSCRLSNTSSIPNTSQLVSACTTYRKEIEEPKLSSRKMSASKTSCTHQLFKKNPKGYNQQLINRTMRLAQSKDKYSQDNKSEIHTNGNTTAMSSLGTTLHSSKSFICKESASKQKTQALDDQHKAKHNFKPTSSRGLNSSRSVSKLDPKSQYSSTQRDSLGIPTQMKNTCENCERLRAKGLSTDFCLQHYESQTAQ